MLLARDLHLYYGASHVLRGVGIRAARGRVTCLLGRNGVGKTSFLRGLAGQLPVRSGRVHWDGEDWTRRPAHARARAGLAYVPQGRDIFPRLTVEENLMTGFNCLPRAEARVPPEVFELFPALADLLPRRGGDLSGGQQQQLAIARALVARPRLLLLDEPTEGIQPSIIKDIEAVIRALAARGDLAILLVEQYYEMACALADDIAVMDRGRIAMAGPLGDFAAADIRRHLTV